MNTAVGSCNQLKGGSGMHRNIKSAVFSSLFGSNKKTKITVYSKNARLKIT